MKKFVTLVSVLVLAWGVHTALAADKGTKEEAVAMVKRAVAYLKTHGRAKALAEFNNPKGQFRDRDLYVFAGNMQGRLLAHGVLPHLAGKDRMDLQDPDGRYITRERLELLKKSNCVWQNYKYLNPVTKKIENKSTYLERVGNLYIGVGVYQ